MRSIIKKKGQVESIIIVIITLFILGIILLFTNTLNNKIFSSLDGYLNNSQYNGTEAHGVLRDIQEVDNSVWDYAFVAIFIAFLIQAAFFSYATRVSIWFFWIFVIFGIIGLAVMTLLSVTWQELTASSQFTDSIARFPMTNFLLGSYGPTVFTGIMLIFLIFLFGKPNEGI